MLPLHAFDPKLCPDFNVTASLAAKGKLALELQFRLTGPLDLLVIPDHRTTPQFRDELWKTTCFELFLQGSGQRAYSEWNFSPSGDWAYYRFLDYRERNLLASRQVPNEPLEVSLRENFLELTVEIPLEPEDLENRLETWNYSLTAVTHTKKEERHYWALTHAGSKPDFHDARSFVGQYLLRSS